jgi:hypothetical protein
LVDLGGLLRFLILIGLCYRVFELSINTSTTATGTLAEWLTRWPASPSRESQPVPSGASAHLSNILHTLDIWLRNISAIKRL